jgi:phosphatidylethanolamine-binding protein (PEBP) family uncharacterized protein
MRRASYPAAIAALLSALALTGCGGTSAKTGTSIRTSAKAATTVRTSTGASASTVAAVTLTSSAIQHGQLPATYTCDGKDINPPLTWGTVPAAIRELSLYALEYTPSPTGPSALGVEWVIAGVNPALHHINAGELPHGAFVLFTGNGKHNYSICPPKGQTKHYEFALYAIPPGVHVTPELSGIALLTNLTNPNPQFQSPATGTITATYTRR